MRTKSYLPNSLVAQTVKNLPVMQGAWIQSLGRENPLPKKGISFPRRKWQPTPVFLSGDSM